MRRRSLALSLAAVVFIAACGSNDSTAAAPAPWFDEVAASSGITFRHVSGFEQRFHFPEIMGSGAALADFDGDGDLDLLCVQSGDLVEPERAPRSRLYENRGVGHFVDVSEASGLAARHDYGMGCACGDFDRDGDVDLYVTCVGANVLYENLGGLRFRDVTERAGVGDPSWSTSATFVDYDGDGRLDLLVANYVRWSPGSEMQCFFREKRRDYCNPNNYGAPARDTLYHNLGDGRFADVSEAVGLGTAFGNGLGVACGDVDGDGRVDLFVANDMTPNQLWIQTPDGKFRDRALVLGCALSSRGEAESGMGVQLLDLEGDGQLDLFVTHLRGQGPVLFSGRGGSFDDRTARFGLSAPALQDTGFGLGFADFDHDGDLDLYLANGHVILEEPFAAPRDPYAQENRVMEQDAPRHFVELAPSGGTSTPLIATSRGAAFGDIDEDGDIDVVVVNRDGPVHVLRNVAPKRGNWIRFRVVDEHGSDALGARVRIVAAGSTQWRTVDAGYSYCSSNDPRVHFGLGAATRVDLVEVHWPGGRTTTHGPFEAGATHVLRR